MLYIFKGTNTHWADYATFASYAGGGSAALQFANKFINSKYNSVMGSYEPKEEFHADGNYRSYDKK